MSHSYEDLLYEERDATAFVTINRADKMNAMRTRTYPELADAIQRAGWNRDISSIVLSGAGTRAFCVGGDTSEPKSERLGGRGTVGVPVEQVHAAVRDVPKPVIAKVRGYAIGGGNVLATICDLTIAGESAIFGQVGPKMGSVDPGLGTAYLARIIGEKRAREFWYMCRRYSARDAYEMGLVNKVVPDEDLDAEVERWCAELAERSPTAIAIAKRSFNADTEQIRAIGALGFEAVALYYNTQESKEGGAALREKRPARFREARDRDRQGK